LWGTDWPSPGIKSMKDNLDQFMAVTLPDPVKEMVTRSTPLRLFPTR